MPVSVPRLDSLADAIPPIFMQCQVSVASHRKNVIALAKIHGQTSAVWEEVPPRGIKLTGEKAFNDRFIDMVDRILPIKKGIPNADRIVKFIGAFILHISQKAAEEKAAAEDDDDEDTPTSRLVATLLKHTMKGFGAKDKTVRYRVVQIIAELIFSLGELDEDLYTNLRASLLERVRDKETHVRLQAVIALARLQRGEEGSENEDEENLTDVLVDILQFDPAAEVRRAALINLTVSPPTLPAILTRTRDQDNGLRKIVYHHVLAGLPSPLVLTIAQREEICQNGLGDREPTVRAAAGRLIGSWVDNENVGGIEGFLKMLDVTTSKVAEDALFSVFVTRPDLFDAIEFPDVFWEELSPERAFLARVFVDHCKSLKDDARVESALPVVTALAFRIQIEYNGLMALISASAEREERGEEEDEESEMEQGDKEFVISELLKLAVNLDYADETGRRKMFALIRDMASAELLPEGLINKCLEVLRVLSSSERDLFMLVVEIVHELRDNVKTGDDQVPDDNESQMGDGDVSQQNVIDPQAVIKASVKAMEAMDAETRVRWEDVNLRCLTLCIGTLERVNGTLEDNSILDGLLSDLVLPAIYQKQPVWRERGMTLLGLMCLISKNMAKKSAQLFVGQAQPPANRNVPRAVIEIQLRALQMLFDIVMVFHFNGLEREGGPKDGEAKILAAFEGALQDESSPDVHAAACEGMAKLMLSGIVTDEEVLARLVGLFLDPGTADNQALRQCLSYFFPVYCYSSTSNQRRMQKIFMKAMETMSDLFNELEEDEEMVTPAKIGLMLIDWTDPVKTVQAESDTSDESIHIDIAIDIVRALFDKEMTKERKKVYAQLLGKLHIPEEIDDDKLRSLMLLISNLRRRRPLTDTTSKNALIRFEANLSKKFVAQLESFDEAEFRELEQLKALFEFLDEVESDAGEEIQLDPPKRPSSKPSAKPRSQSVEATSKARPKPKSKAPAKETIKEESEPDSQEEVDEEEEEVSVPPLSRTKKTSARKPGTKSKKQPVSDDEEEEDVPPVPKKATRKSTTKPTKSQVSDHESEEDDSTPPPRKPSSRKSTVSKRKSMPEPISDDEEDEVNQTIAHDEEDDDE